MIHRSAAAGVAAAAALVALPGAHAAAADSTPPSLLALSLSPASVDVSAGPAEVVARATMTDDLAGVSAVDGISSTCDFGFTAPSSLIARSPGGTTVGGFFRRIAGDQYEATIQLPQFAHAGTWTITNVFAIDCAGNTSFRTTEQLAERGFATRFEVTGVSDTTPPSLQALSLSPMSVDTSDGAADVVVRARITDDLSGVAAIDGFSSTCSGSGPSTSHVVARSPGGVFAADIFRRVTGDEYESTIRVEPLAQAGTWTITVILGDCVGNTGAVTTDQLVQRGFPAGFEVTGASDTTPPSLHALSVSLMPVDAGGDRVDVVARATITDDISGVSALREFSSTCSGFGSIPSTLTIRSPGGTVGVGIFRRLAGDEYELTFRLAPSPEAGRWMIAVALRDCTGNTSILGSQQLADRGFPNSFEVRPADTTPPVIVPRVEGPRGNDGWFVGDVTVTWDVTDAESVISATSGCGATTIEVDTAGTTLTCEATSAGGTARESVTIRRDATAPTVACQSSPAQIWPPNNQLVPIAVAIVVSDQTSGPNGFVLTSVTSNESLRADAIAGFDLGTADTAGSVQASRSGTGEGRIYRIAYSASDVAGNAASCAAEIIVPHDMRPLAAP